MDVDSLDRLLEVATQARNDEIVERSMLLAQAIAAATSGGDAAKSFTDTLKGYAPAAEREAAEAQDLDKNLTKLQRLFGGG